MKLQSLALVAALSLALVPTTSSAVTMGDATYKVAAGVGGFIAANAALGFAATSAYLGAYTGMMSFAACQMNEPMIVLLTIPSGIGSAVSGTLSVGCAYLSYRCFQAMLAPIEPEIVQIHHYHHDEAEAVN